MKLKIANPIYDSVFKYLVSDPESARLLISRLMDEEVVSLTLAPTEHQVKVKSKDITVFHIDFAARVRTGDGGEKKVLIEIQKAKLPTDIMRFRNYLATHYGEEGDKAFVGDGESRPLPIFTIYFLGHELARVKVPVIRVRRSYQDGRNGETLVEREPFIEMLTHDSVVVQIPLLGEPRRSELEELLSIFDQGHQDPRDRHFLMLDDDGYPSAYYRLLRRLLAAAAEAEVLEEMRIEDSYVAELEKRDREIAARDEALKAKDAALQKKAEALKEKAEALKEKEAALARERREKAEALKEKAEALQEKAEALQEKEAALARERREKEQVREAAVAALMARGLSRAEAEAILSGVSGT